MQQEANEADDFADYWSCGTVPLQEIIAEHDPFKPRSAWHEMRDQFGDRIATTVMKDAAHALFPEQPAAIAAATRKRTVQQMEDDLAKLSMCAAKVRTRDEWSRHPQGEFLATTPPVSIEQIGSAGRQHPLPPAKARALEGVRVLSLTHVLAGPTVGHLLGEHGADVIELRNPYFQYVIPL